MKPAFLLVLIHFIFMSPNFAQTNIPKGSVLLGGDLSFGSSKYSSDNNGARSTGFSIFPTAGKAVKDNLFIGLVTGLSYSRVSLDPGPSTNDSIKAHSYSYGIFARKYKPLKNNFYLFLQGQLGGSNGKYQYIQNAGPGYDVNNFSINASLSPGVSYRLNSKLHLETGFNSLVGIGYSSQENAPDPSTGHSFKQKSIHLYTSLNNFSSQFYLGFRLLLQKNRKEEPQAPQG